MLKRLHLKLCSQIVKSVADGSLALLTTSRRLPACLCVGGLLGVEAQELVRGHGGWGGQRYGLDGG